jgi:NAD+ synthase (glutamine-hydrolysing)
MIKVHLAEINTTPCDFVGNVVKIKEQIKKHDDEFKDKIQVILFPELTIPGYGVKDMIYNTGFIEKNHECLIDIANFSKEICPDNYIILGYIDKNNSGIGKPFRNMAAVIKNGSIIATYQKRLLPFYDVFDEGRYFEPGKECTVISIGDEKYGIAICEDLWAEDKGETGNWNYNINPTKEYADLKVNGILSLNSSPYYYDKPGKRLEIIQKLAEKYRIDNIYYCNQIGGNDELYFDGNSFDIINGICNSKYFNKISFNSDKMLLNSLINGLRDYGNKTRHKKFVVGSSGGVDSALVITLACMAFGPENVYAIKMPSIFSSKSSIEDAVQLHKNLGCHDLIVKINHQIYIESINSQLGITLQNNPFENYNTVADENIQARMRGNILMHFSNLTGALLLTTGNKTELSMGYCTLYGDMNGGFNPIGDLYKNWVYAICKEINSNKEIIPNSILTKAPSAELALGQTDEASLKINYKTLDKIVELYIEKRITFNSHLGISKEQYESIIKRIDSMEFKRKQAAPCLKISRVSFGCGRRIPIVKG